MTEDQRKRIAWLERNGDIALQWPSMDALACGLLLAGLVRSEVVGLLRGWRCFERTAPPGTILITLDTVYGVPWLIEALEPEPTCRFVYDMGTS